MNALQTLTGGAPGIGMGPRPTGPAMAMGAMTQMQMGQHAMQAGNQQPSKTFSCTMLYAR